VDPVADRAEMLPLDAERDRVVLDTRHLGGKRDAEGLGGLP
jgi:hypothetical protein